MLLVDIVLNPVFDPRVDQSAFLAEFYSMTSRARVFLAVIVGNTAALELGGE